MKTLYLTYHKTCKRRTWHTGDLDWGAPTYLVTYPFDHKVTWYHITMKLLYLHFRNAYKHQSWHWWLRLRSSPCPVTRRFDHMVTRWYTRKWKYYITFFTRPERISIGTVRSIDVMRKIINVLSLLPQGSTNKFARVMAKGNGLSRIKSYDPLLT